MRITTVITIGDKQYRNLEEQVKKNMDDIQYILEEEGVLNEFGIKIVGQITDAGDLPDPDTYQGEYGDAYTVGTNSPYTLYIYTRANGTHPNDYWFNIGQFPLAGPQGPTGPQGLTGPQGTRGNTWQNGTSTPTTSDNLSGDKYLNTTNGDVYNYTGTTWQLVGNIRGPQGIQGQQGLTGPQGPQGIQGPTGPQGPAGPAFVIAGTVANEGQLPAPSTLADNIAYLVGNDTDGYDLYVQLQDTDTWQNVGKVEGVQGPTGPQGPQGPTGPMPQLASERGSDANIAMSQLGIENIFYNTSVQLGSQTGSPGPGSIRIGNNAGGSSFSTTVVGDNASATQPGAVAIGDSANSRSFYAVALGAHTTASGQYSAAVGYEATVSNYGTIALGYNAVANSNSAIALGHNAKSTIDYAVAIGYSSNASGGSAVAIGASSAADTLGGIALGAAAKTYGISSTAVGYNARVNGNNSIALGPNSNAQSDNTIVLGNGEITALECQVQTISALSDSRVKEDVSLANTAQCLIDVNRLPVSRYKYKDFTGVHIDVHRTGFMADDVEKVFPKSIIITDRTFPLLDENGDKTYEQATDEEGNPIYEQATDENGVALFNEDGSIKYDEAKPVMKESTFIIEDVKSIAMEMAIPTLWGAVQELTKRIESLEAELQHTLPTQ